MAELSPHERMRQRAEDAAVASSRAEIESLLLESAKDVLLALARNSRLQEGDLLRLLERKDLGQEILIELAHHPEARRSHSVQLAFVRHPKTPRKISLPLMKFLYVFDLLRVAQTPAVPTDVKMAAEETLLRKLPTLPRGERISVARRGTGRLAASLLISADVELIRAVLDNPYLTEANLLKVLTRKELVSGVVEEIAQHKRWSHRYELRLGLIRHRFTPLARVLAFLPDVTVTDLQEVCLDRRMHPQVRKYIQAHCVARLNRQRRLTATD
jgi:hypothetical protein